MIKFLKKRTVVPFMLQEVWKEGKGREGGKERKREEKRKEDTVRLKKTIKC